MSQALFPVEVIIRQNTMQPGLAMVLDRDRLTFRYGEKWETYHLRAGDAELVACSPQAFPTVALLDHVRATALPYANELTAAA